MKRKLMIFLVLGIVFLLYYLLCGKYGGFHLSVLFIWLVAGIFCLILAGLELRFGRIPIPAGLKKGGLVCLAVLLTCFVFVEGLIISGMGAKGKTGLDYMIVLGAGVRGTRPTRALRHRIETAADYLHENPETVAIVSGGQGRGEEISEADCMRNELVKLGIEEERILTEDQSRDTVENIVNSFRLIPDDDASVGIVTNNFHAFRAVRIAEKQVGKEVCGIAAPFRSILLPHYMVREFFSIALDAAKRKL